MTSEETAVVYGWDLSHYDGVITPAIAKAAYAQGIRFTTHKISEGTAGADATAAAALAACRDAGIPALGGYFVVRSGAVQPQIDELLKACGQAAPWWSDWPHWFWQVDLERWAYDDVAASTGIAAAIALREQTGRLTVLYASAGQYGAQLASWDGPLWNAHYGTNPAGAPASIYPGNDSTGWQPYSGKTPLLLQFGSRATIGGATTCDVDAYRGTVDQLLDVIGAAMAGSVWDEDVIPNNSPYVGDSPAHTPPGTNPTTKAAYALGRIRTLAEAVPAQIAAVGAQIDALAGSVATPPGGSTPPTPPAGTVQLDAASIEAIAQRTADIIAARMTS